MLYRNEIVPMAANARLTGKPMPATRGAFNLFDHVPVVRLTFWQRVAAWFVS